MKHTVLGTIDSGMSIRLTKTLVILVPLTYNHSRTCLIIVHIRWPSSRIFFSRHRLSALFPRPPILVLGIRQRGQGHWARNLIDARSVLIE